MLLLRFSRTVRVRWAVPALVVVGAAATYVSFRGALPGDQMLVAAAGGGLLTPLPYLADRLLSGRLTGVARTLVFPMADTAVVFLFGAGEFGTTGHVAGTQVGNLPLLQVAAVGGQWAIGFLIAWAAAVANEVWDAPGRCGRCWCYGAVLGAVLLAGGARLALDPPSSGPTVRIAGLAPNRAASDAFMAARVAPGARTAGERAEIRERYLTPLLDDLVDRTQRAARDGARIVVWAEASAYEFVEDRNAIVERARAVARSEGIYLQIGVVWLLPAERSPFTEIRAIMFDPNGATVWDYLKTTTPLGDGNVPGPGIVPTVDTPYGRLATVICFDAGFPDLVRQAGRAGVGHPPRAVQRLGAGDRRADPAGGAARRRERGERGAAGAAGHVDGGGPPGPGARAGHQLVQRRSGHDRPHPDGRRTGRRRDDAVRPALR